MSFLPHTDDDRAAMLRAIGIDGLEDLFAEIPKGARFPALDLPPAASEPEVMAELRDLAARNVVGRPGARFLGAGTYNHFVPATVRAVLARGEFYTAYTPYQPELSQGLLQATFEYQSMICRLTGMEVASASHYDGATALAEAALLAIGATGRKGGTILVSPEVHPQYRRVLRTYLRSTTASVTGDEDPAAEASAVLARIDDRTAALVVQSPDFFGRLVPIAPWREAADNAGALLIVVTDPVALGLFRAPCEDGADIVVADGQGLGLAPSFGGPHLGIFATRAVHMRRIAGRLVGETTDAEGRRGYVLTLTTREQHIRRARATSNICTNAALSALAAAVHLATLGQDGLRRVAELCWHRSHYAAARLAEIPGVAINPFDPDTVFFKEFVLRLPRQVMEVNAALARTGIVGGYDLGADYPHLPNHALLAVTEMNSRAEIDRLAAALREALA